jgi:DNA mismatch repair protein MSH4
MTHERIQEVIDIARQKYDALASLSDAIALIDMCHSFADNVASNRLPWCRPIVTDCSSTGSEATYQNTGELPGNCTVGSGSIAIRNGRYAIDVSKTGLMSSGSNCGDFIPNDTYASAFQNFTLLSGINGSGKSTYLKQLAITVILAHCGSYVPAEEAFIPIRDRLCTRIGTSDDQEHNISTFMQEMKDTAFICRNATDRSLILIDELGRATSNEDGVAIAWAVSEFMLVKRAMTFFVTHYPQLCRLADVYPNVQNQHLGTVVEEEGVRYMHKILPGPCQMSADYGIEMAATCGWQRDVVEMVRFLSSFMQFITRLVSPPSSYTCFN